MTFSAAIGDTMQTSQLTYRILVADDQPAILDALKMLLRSEGFEVDVMRSPQIVLESLALKQFFSSSGGQSPRWTEVL